MPNWRTITLTDLQAGSSSGKVTLIRNAAVARSLPDPAPAAIANVTGELVAMIGFSGRYVVDQDKTKLPNGLIDLALKKIIREMTWAVGLPLDEADRDDSAVYEKRLEKIRQGEWPIETADDPVAVPTVQASTVSPLICAPDRQWSRRAQDGA